MNTLLFSATTPHNVITPGAQRLASQASRTLPTSTNGPTVMRDLIAGRAPAAARDSKTPAVELKRPKFRAKNNSAASNAPVTLSAGPIKPLPALALSRMQRTYPRTLTVSRTFLVTGLFNDRLTAERACQSVTERGYVLSEINFLMSNETRSQHLREQRAEEQTDGLSARDSTPRASVREIAGEVAAAAVRFERTQMLPGLNLVIAGPLATASATAGGSPAKVGLLGTLGEWNIPEKRVMDYEAALKQGKILMAVKPRTVADANHFEQAWSKDDADLWGRASP